MITDEKKLKNASLFLEKLNSIGIDTSKFDSELMDKITNATFAINQDSNYCYDGSLLNVVLRVLTPFAVRINDLLNEDKKADMKSLVKVSLLSHLAKCEMFEKNDNSWEIEKRGMIYKYKKSNVALKLGMKSLLLCQGLGITFTDEEAEAMTILDKDINDEQTRYYSTPLSYVIKEANDLTFIQGRKL